MIGSYPSLSLHDPKTFSVEFVTQLSQYPFDVVQAAIKTAARASPNFIPSIPAIEAEAEKLFADTRQTYTYAQQWEAGAQKQSAEERQFKLDDLREPLEHRKKVAERIRAELAAAGMNIGETLPQQSSQQSRWKRLSDAELLTAYPKTVEAPPDADL